MSIEKEHDTGLTVEQRAEAATWLARLHGPERTATVERGFRRWLRASAAHRRALQQLTEQLEIVEQLRTRPLPWHSPAAGRARQRRAPLIFTAAAAMAVVLVVAGVLLYLSSLGVSTGIGEQRTVTLEDGTRVYLNTSTKLVVRFSKQRRAIDLKSGEALFEVMKDPARPFIVTASNRQLRAIGTSFVVRRDGTNVAVTLIEGSVAVSKAAPDAGGEDVEPEDSIMLAPGERLTYAAAGNSKLDRPTIDKVIAWRHGQVAIDDLPLRQAVAEMNRYSSMKLIVESTAAGELRVGGFFRMGDSRSFARAVAGSYNLQVIERGEEIVLTD